MARFVAKYVTLGSAHPNKFFVSYIMLWEQSVAKWLPKPGVYYISMAAWQHDVVKLSNYICYQIREWKEEQNILIFNILISWPFLAICAINAMGH